MSQRHDLLKALINDPHSTPGERAAAHKELYGSEHQQQALQDREIESYLSFDRSLGVRMAVEHRQSLSVASQQLLNDFATQSFGMAPDAGSEGRLQTLLENTSSDAIKKQAIAALKVIARLREKGLPIHATTTP